MSKDQIAFLRRKTTRKLPGEKNATGELSYRVASYPIAVSVSGVCNPLTRYKNAAVRNVTHRYGYITITCVERYAPVCRVYLGTSVVL